MMHICHTHCIKCGKLLGMFDGDMCPECTHNLLTKKGCQTNMDVENNTKTEPSSYPKEALKAAKDLGYPSSILDKIRQATSDNEIARIMTNARHAYFA